MTHTGKYQAASGASGKRLWRVIYLPKANDALHHYELTDQRGTIVRFGSYRTAAIRATRLNWTEQPPTTPILGNTYWLMPHTEA